MLDGPEPPVAVDLVRTRAYVERVGVRADAGPADASGLGKLRHVPLEYGLHGLAKGIEATWVAKVIPPEGDGSTGPEETGDSIKTRLGRDPMERSGCSNKIESLWVKINGLELALSHLKSAALESLAEN